jgi:AcrR family transcriptional regulator
MNRSSTAKGRAKREQALEAAFAVFAREGERGTSLRAIAKESNISLTGLMHHFESKDQLLTEVLRASDDAAAMRYETFGDVGDPGEFMAQSMTSNAAHPERARLYIHLVAASVNFDHPAHAYFRERYERFRGVVSDYLRKGQDAGAVDPELDPEFVATTFLSIIEGAQMQWLNDPAVDMGALIRRGWNLLLARG